MSISHYIKVIGRGKDGARPITREQAADMFGQVLDGAVTDLEIGAFCLAMRIKGESPQEMAGFLDATYERLHRVPASALPLVVLPSYNGARKLPLLTPLLALLVAKQGLPVLIHGAPTESNRVFVTHVLEALGIEPLTAIHAVAPGHVAFAPTELLCPGLKRLLDVRRIVGVRNPAHSLVKLMNPCAGAAVIVGSYTHAEYAVSMAAVFALMGSTALLLRGTEGEAVAHPRRAPAMQAFVRGEQIELEADEPAAIADGPGLSSEIDATSTAAYIRDVLSGKQPVPAPIALQVEHILRLSRAARSQETRQ